MGVEHFLIVFSDHSNLEQRDEVSIYVSSNLLPVIIFILLLYLEFLLFVKFNDSNFSSLFKHYTPEDSPAEQVAYLKHYLTMHSHYYR